MADERYQWLDLEAAERLLRGDRVEDLGDHARAEAEMLAEALESARPAALSGTAPLPGEENAMAAFRAASQARATAQATVPAPASDLADVRLLAPAGRRARRRRWTRSVRFGLAASVAGLAVGGVAVATGTGMLPTPFGPAPASSVSAAVSPGPVESGSPDGGGESRTPGHGDASGTVPSPTASGGPSETLPPTAGGTDGAEPGKPDATSLPDKDRAAERAKYLPACQDLRAGRLDAADRRRLAEADRRGQTVKTFCDRLLGDEGKNDGSSEGATGGDGKEDDGQDGRTSGSDSTSGSNETTGTRTGSVSGTDRVSGADATTPVPVVTFQPLSPRPAAMDDEAASAPSHSA